MGFVAHTLAQALEFSLVEVILEDRLVIGVGTLLDDDASTLAGREAANIGKALLGNDDVLS